MQNLVLVCIDGIYLAIFGHLVLVFTQDYDEARRIGMQYAQKSVNPYWWVHQVRITPDSQYAIMEAICLMQQALGFNGLNEFCSLNGDVFSLKGFALE